MTIFVDALIEWNMTAKSARGRRYFGEGKPSCHMVTDGPLAELHAFARQIHVASWFHNAQDFPHYDLTPEWRARAIAAGAVEMTRAEAVGLMRKNRAARQEKP